MANYISNVNVSPYGSEEQEISRKKKLAQMLQEQSMEPLQAPQGGAFASPISPLQVLAKGLQAYKGKQADTEAKGAQEELSKRQQTERQAALTAALRQGMGAEQPPAEMGGGPAMPPNPMAMAQSLAGAQDPALQQTGMGLLGKQFENMIPQKPQPFSLTPGAQRFGADGKMIASVPPNPPQAPAPAPFSLPPGGRRYDAAGKVVATAPEAAQKPPPGYRTSQEGNLQAIPGGPADLKLQGVLNQDTALLQNTTGALDRLAVAANEVMTAPGLGRITGLAGVVPNVPGFAGADTAAKLQTLKAQVGFNVLQEMRNASKTGGALGQVTEKELGFLQNALAAIDTSQSEDQMKESLQKIIDYAAGAKVRLNQAFNTKHSGQQAPGTQSQFREGQTATGPNGQKIVFRNGAWQPASR